MKLLLLISLFLLSNIVKPENLHIAVISDPRVTAVTPTIDTELIPTIKNLTLDYLLITGQFSSDVTDTEYNVTNSMKIFFTKISPFVSKFIFWIPSSEFDPVELFQIKNFTLKDVNIHSNLVNLVNGFYIFGLGEIKGMDFTNLTNQLSQLNQPSTVILLSNKGPTGFSTTLKRSKDESIDVVQLLDPSLWSDTGNQNFTNFLSDAGVQQNVVMNVHGGNPQGIGDSSFGNIRIINPGSIYFTKSFVITEFIKNQMGSWVPNNWKFYRFGNITSWSPNPGGYKLSVVDSCTITIVSVAPPYVSDIYSKISIALYSIGIVSVVALLSAWVVISYKSETV